VAVRFSVRLAGYSSVALTKLDVLDAFASIPVCVAYRDPRTGTSWETIPAGDALYGRLVPVWEELSGWQTDTTACRSWAELPAAAQAYVSRLEELAGVPIGLVSVGPERDQMIVRGTPDKEHRQ
jgi:adenylosuccinate synthase